MPENTPEKLAAAQRKLQAGQPVILYSERAGEYVAILGDGEPLPTPLPRVGTLPVALFRQREVPDLKKLDDAGLQAAVAQRLREQEERFGTGEAGETGEAGGEPRPPARIPPKRRRAGNRRPPPAWGHSGPGPDPEPDPLPAVVPCAPGQPYGDPKEKLDGPKLLDYTRHLFGGQQVPPAEPPGQ